jgi:hypothetical protein
MTKIYIFTFFTGFKNSPKNVLTQKFNKNLCLQTQKQKKYSKMGDLIIFEEIMNVQSFQNFEKKNFFPANVHNFIKNEDFRALKKLKFKYLSTNWFQ